MGDILEMSTMTEDGVMDVKTKACDLLLQHRVELKYKSKKVEGILNRLHVAEPVARDTVDRPAFVPAAALKKQKDKLEAKMNEGDDEMETSVPRKRAERDIELEMGDEYNIDLQKYDIVPETWQGHNITDFVDVDIMEKLEALEKE